MYDLLWEANGGIRNLGWARMVTNYKETGISIKLYNDGSFYGKDLLPGYSEGFVFTPRNCPPHLLARISRHLFIIKRKTENDQANYNPAVLTALGRYGVCVNDKNIALNASTILRTGDSIRLAVNGPLLFQFFDDREFDTQYVPNSILNKYHLAGRLGKGGQSSVRLVHRFVDQGKFAMKIIPKKRFDAESLYQHTKRLDHMFNEVSRTDFSNCFLSFSFFPQVDTMKKLHHPNIIRFEEHCQSAFDLFIVMELGERGNLLEYIHSFREKRLPEYEAKFAFYQICQGLRHIHSLKIAHRDLKPENVFIASCRVAVGKQDTLFKIGDFGYSRPAVELITQVGTFCYLPPEILKLEGEYTIAADIWTLGCLLFGIVSGSFPFDDSYGTPVKDQIQSAQLNFDRLPVWKQVNKSRIRYFEYFIDKFFHQVSPFLPGLIASMIKRDAAQRPPVDRIINKAVWFRDDKNLKSRVKMLYANQPFDHDLAQQMSTVSLGPSSSKNPRVK